ncbi:hypothetical protein ACFX5D_05550 [Flavobacterium sp. LB3P45]|uniref:Uncharacterized protein n=1 Tax=Flavobacterium fructosi TaxID=3230416 RepID=A0ABW6HK67_9FLAO
MKIAIYILLLVFISFLLTPAIVSLIAEDNDTSILDSFSEDEKAHKEIKAVFISIVSFEVERYLSYNSSLIFSENLSKQDKITSQIFIPPPNQV